MDSVKTDLSVEEDGTTLQNQSQRQEEEFKNELNKESSSLQRSSTMSFIPQDKEFERDQKQSSINQSIPLIQKKRTIIDKDKIRNNKQSNDDDLTTCMICSSILKDPLECNSCRKAFCRECLKEWEQEGEKKCPNGCKIFSLEKPHPLLLKQLSQIDVGCENKEEGCTFKAPYDEVIKHQTECDYMNVRCSNFGCQVEVLRKEYEKHQEECEYKTLKCEKCESQIKQGESNHDCIVALTSRFDKMKNIMLGLKRKLENYQEIHSQETSTKFARFEMSLLNMKAIYFRPEFGSYQEIKDNLIDLPKNVKAVIIKFMLTDINLRRAYHTISLNQEGNTQIVDLTNSFIVGPTAIPSFGLTTELILPWSSKLPPCICLQTTLVPHGVWPYNPYVYASITVGGLIFE